MTEAEKFVPIRKLAESGFLTDSLSEISEEEAARLPYQIREVLEVIDHGPLLNEELDRESKKQLNGGERNE